MADALRVLMIEDLATDAELVEREVRLAVPACEFRRVDTRQGLLDALASFLPDFILSDFKLPDFDGLTALELARQRVPDVPFVIITGSKDEDTAVACMKAGAWDYVLKEHIKRLGPAMLAALDRRRLILEREAALKSLRASEELFRNLFEHHVAVKLIIDPLTSAIVDANRAASRFYGWTQDELRRMTIGQINTLPPDDLEREMARARLQQRAHFFFRHRRADGSIRDVEVLTSMIRAGERELLHSIVHDITERMRVEEERERLLAAIEQAGEAILITDRDGAIQYVNPAFESVSGYSRHEAIGNTPRILKSGEQDEAFYRGLWQTIASGATWKSRMVNRRKDGTLYTEDATISPVADGESRIINYVAVKRDVTEQLQMAAQLQQAQKFEAVGRLAGGVAHDYNNMLSVILGYTELALDKTEPSDPLHADLEEVVGAARRSADITRQLLAFARKQTVAPVVLDLNDAVQGMLRMIHRLIGEDVEMVWRPAPGLWPVRMDPVQIHQILANLCVNARDAIDDVGEIAIETLNVTLDSGFGASHPGGRPGDFVLLSVRDNGSGMDREAMAHLFEPFFTTKGPGRGTGLGLSTVYGIVTQNDGFIQVESEPHVGTTLNIYLPRHAGEAGTDAEDAAFQSFSSRGETVLLVEDEPAILKLGQTNLERLGYRVMTAAAPHDAVSVARSHVGPLHLLVTDVVMPGMNGRDLAERVRALHPDVRVLFMSGYTADVIAQHGVLEPGVYYLQKPFSLTEMAAKVRATLDRR